MKKTISGMIIGAVMGMTVFGCAVSAQAAGITQESAQKTALEAAGVKEEDVIFKKAGKELDDGREIFEVDFFIPGEVKFEFDIDAASGAIIEQDMDLWEPEDDFEYAALIEKAGKEIKVPDGEITELQAKTIALKDAGLKTDEVLFTKCKKDLDDGIEKFEIEFKTSDFMEYEYEIDAADGTILEKSADFDD